MNRLYIMLFLLFASFSFLYPFSSEQIKINQKNEFLKEEKCNPQSAFSNFDIELNEEEIKDYQRSKPPAKIIVYARQIGIGLLMRYIALKNYITNIVTKIKNKISVK